MRLNLKLTLLSVIAMLSVTACDGGPPRGELTVENTTDRPVLMLSGSAELGPIGESIRKADVGFGSVAGPIAAGETETFSYGRDISEPDGSHCTFGHYWVITSNEDNITDFAYPLDPEAVTIQQTIEEPCFAGATDRWTIDNLPN